MIYCNREFRSVNIPGYSNYMVSKEGDIYSIDRNRLLKHAIDEYGVHKMRMQTDAHCEQHKFKVSNIDVLGILSLMIRCFLILLLWINLI